MFLEFLVQAAGLFSCIVFPVFFAIYGFTRLFKRYNLVREEKQEEFSKPSPKIPQLNNAPPWMENAEEAKGKVVKYAEEKNLTPEEKSPPPKNETFNNKVFSSLPKLDLPNMNNHENLEKNVKHKENVEKADTFSLEKVLEKRLVEGGDLQFSITLKDKSVKLLGKEWDVESVKIATKPKEEQETTVGNNDITEERIQDYEDVVEYLDKHASGEVADLSGLAKRKRGRPRKTEEDKANVEAEIKT